MQEYANVDDSYGVRAVQLKAPPPPTPFSIGELSGEHDTIITIKGTPVNNSGFFDPGDDEEGPGFNRLSVNSTGDIKVSQIKFLSPDSISVMLHTKNQSPGGYFLVINNPDGQAVATNYSVVAGPAKKLSREAGVQIITMELKKMF